MSERRYAQQGRKDRLLPGQAGRQLSSPPERCCEMVRREGYSSVRLCLAFNLLHADLYQVDSRAS